MELNLTALKGQVTKTCDMALAYIEEADRHHIFEALPDEKATNAKARIEGIRQSLERMLTGKFLVAIAGQMKAGKSTLMNSMIFREEILPSASTPQTAKLTLIRHGEKKSATANFYSQSEWDVIETDKDRNELYAQIIAEAKEQVGSQLYQLLGNKREIGLDRLKDYVAAFNEEKDQGKYVTITNLVEIDFPYDGNWPLEIEFVDTPGTNDPNQLREQVTLDFLSKADAVVLVLYGARPGDREDINFLKKTLLPIGLSKIIIAVNKVDKLPPEERKDIAHYLKTVFQDALADSGETSSDFLKKFQEILDLDRIYPVSAIQALLGRAARNIANHNFFWKNACLKKGIETKDRAVADSGLETLEKGLSDFLFTVKGRILLLGPLKKAKGALEDIFWKLEARINRLKQKAEDMRKGIEQLERELQKEREKLKQVEDFIETIQTTIKSWIAEELKQFRADCQIKLKNCSSDIRDDDIRKIDQLSWMDGLFKLQDKLEGIGTDIGWRLKTLEDDFESLFQRNLDRVRHRLSGDLMDEVKIGIPDYHNSPRVMGQILNLGQINFEAAIPSFGAIVNIKDQCSFFSRLFTPTSNKGSVKRMLQEHIISFEKKVKSYLAGIEERLRNEIFRHTDPIFQGIRQQVKNHISDIEAGIEQKRGQQSGYMKEQENIRDEVEKLKLYGSQGKDMLGQINQLISEIEK